MLRGFWRWLEQMHREYKEEKTLRTRLLGGLPWLVLFIILVILAKTGVIPAF
jgi:hypothetical protein